MVLLKGERVTQCVKCGASQQPVASAHESPRHNFGSTTAIPHRKTNTAPVTLFPYEYGSSLSAAIAMPTMCLAPKPLKGGQHDRKAIESYAMNRFWHHGRPLGLSYISQDDPSPLKRGGSRETVVVPDAGVAVQSQGKKIAMDGLEPGNYKNEEQSVRSAMNGQKAR
ncbi:unnamed protein product [Fusarium venenatum]|uniref:Uncharacterized protein n=1 Tax=Fusarium venenatum TaxID=56646 RepID=A0A2L2TAT1_9HYPO|nr:uncharacterized protein FVRRES_11313 [Fusarium venenatum]CEI38622.1 unnamed protein product [Fusarium venenatum]